MIEGLKYDLRIYVMLYGLNPLRIFIHDKGLARFATEPYERPRASNIDNIYVHLTNYAINKMNINFNQNNKKAKDSDNYDSEEEDDESDEEETGHKRSLPAIFKIILEQGGDPDAIMDEIKDIIIKTIIVGQPYMNHIYKVCQPECIDNSMCFQILGFDILIDNHFKPWLVEVNHAPSFATDSALDYDIKKNIVSDALALLNISQERRENFIKTKNEQMVERILSKKVAKLGVEEKENNKQARIEQRFEHERMKLN